jgi:formylglycine-generating enzyme required for sulfatase activity
LAIVISLFTVSCDNMFDDRQEDPRDQSYEIRTAAKYRGMLTAIPAGNTVTISGEGASGVFVRDRAVILGAYSVAMYETTWELWKEVYDWARLNGYSIANAGMEGHGPSGTGGKGWAASSRISRPVTGVSWLDAVVWCNAYSELCGYEPVYHYAPDPALPEKAAVLRTSEAGVTVEARRDRNGFRLPLEAEWEFAARGGATGEPDWKTYDYAGAGGNAAGDVAWYAANAAVDGSPAYGAHAVGGKKANRLKTFDMSGNVAEWCWDRFNPDPITQETPPDGATSGTERVTRGGSWRSDAASCTVRARASLPPASFDAETGFRVVRTLPAEGDIVNSGDYLPTLVGTHWYWDSPWGMREIDFDTDDHALFTDPAEPPCLYDVSYTYDPALGRGNISGSYPAGDFQLRNNNKTMFMPQFRHFGHSVEFTFKEPE